MHHRWFLMALAVMILLSNHCALASGNLRFDRYTMDDGLSQPQVLTMVQDNRGFMWFGTLGGLNRFDGYEFKHYVHQADDPGSLTSNWIQVLYHDSRGNLWVGTKDGLNRMNLDSGQIMRYLHDPNDDNTISHNEIKAIVEGPQGDIWVGTRHGLNRIDTNNGRINRFHHDPAQAEQFNQ